MCDRENKRNCVVSGVDSSCVVGCAHASFALVRQMFLRCQLQLRLHVTNQKFFHILIGQREKTKLLGIPYQTMQSQKQQQNPSATQPSTTSSSSVDQNNDMTALGLSPEFQEQATTIICRGNLPKAAVEELKKWLFQHFNYPYPNDSEKEKLMAQTGTVWTQPHCI